MPTIAIFNSSGTINISEAVYVIKYSESLAGELDAFRTADQGTAIDLRTVTEPQFINNVFIYRNGILLFNDPVPVLTVSNLQHDVARKTGDLKTLLFFGALREGTIIKIVLLI